ncbi:glycosyltransferase family 2 protein [Massilia arenosa]|uniref:Glycosyltransferase family 2 protein n=1 Tax=Zemynaea arenosa TaxID=2561931 RepID=A0A4Y9S6B6_9BURK|nr:glycosyltransferase family 2 protein [Massilia arenosa]TFW16755.1 glycosyltransferase family 2 protein [Massilia arenosa]
MIQSYRFSIVVPVYNREWCLDRALRSADAFARALAEPVEVVVVDDGSTDRSSAIAMGWLFPAEPTLLHVRLITHLRNRGVCAAKNTGAFACAGKWIVFLDSDDELLPQNARQVSQKIEAHDNSPLQFFECVRDEEICLPGDGRSRSFNLDGLLLGETGGEKLPVVLAELFRACPYDEDLRGYESLSYMRMLRSAAGTVHQVHARRYHTGHDDRLSSRAGLRKRYHELAVGHSRVIREHRAVLSSAALLVQVMRLAKAKIWSWLPL